MYNRTRLTAFEVTTMLIVSVPRMLILALLLTLPMIAIGQWEYETVTTGGTKCDIAVDTNGNPHISYRDGTTGWHLKYAHWDGTDWQITAVETTISVYGATSIAVDVSDIPHIAFKKVNSFWAILYHAWWNGSTWQQEGLDSLAWGDLGEWNSIAIAGDGYPHIVYTVYTSDYDCYLKYTYRDASGWHFEVADSLLNEEFRYVSLALDAVDHPHISYNLATAKDLRYAYWNGSTWQIDTVDTEGSVGKWSSIALDSAGYPHIGYTDYWGVPPTKYTYWDGSAWQFEFVDPADSDLNLYTALALDANDQPHISYGGYYGPLKYAYRDESWQIEVVDETVGCGWTSIAVDDSGSSHIAYYDQAQMELKYAKKSPVPADVTPPAAPQSLIATPGDGEVSLVWRMNLEIDVALYRIYGGTFANPTTLIDSTTSRNDTTKTLKDLTKDTIYYFRITAVDTSGNESNGSETVSVLIVSVDTQMIPEEFTLGQNYPNPFNPITNIRYGLPETSDVSLHIYDITGHEVKTLVNTSQAAGWYTVQWNRTLRDGTPAGAGMYFARIQTGDFSKTIKMAYLK